MFKLNSYFTTKQFVVASLASVVLSTQVSAKWVSAKYDIPHFAQEKAYGCGYATTKMWIHGIKGESPSQTKIRNWKLRFMWNGINAGEFEKIMEHFTGKKFKYHNLKGKRKAQKLVYEELRKQRRPIAIAAATIKADGSKRAGGHWLLMYSADSKGKGLGYEVRRAKLHDSLFGSSFARDYRVISHYRTLSNSELFNHWVPVFDGNYQAVED